MLGKLVEGLFADRVGSNEGTTVVVECRRCGTSLEDGESCPHCATADVVRFEF